MKNIHVLPTDKPTGIWKLGDNLHFSIMDKVRTDGTGFHLYITSNEEIKEGDWFIHSSHGITNIYKAKSVVKESIITTDDNGCWIQYCQKIILTDNKSLIKDGVQAIDDEFLEWFVNNPSCEEVEVIKQELNTDYKSNWEQKFYYKIIIPKEEPKQETLEEAAKNESEYLADWEDKDMYVKGFIDGAECQVEQDKNKYSEEEVRDLFRKYQYDLAQWVLRMEDDIDGSPIPTEWFEQFKKK